MLMLIKTRKSEIYNIILT